MATVFWDQKGVLFVNFVEAGRTTASQIYCETHYKLRRAVQNQRRGIMNPGIVGYHPTHVRTIETIQKFR